MKSLFSFKLSLLFLVLGHFSKAQVNFSMPMEITRTPGGILVTAAGDLDGDGLAEIVYGGYDDRIIIFFQNDNHQFPSHRVLDENPYQAQKLLVLDREDDGDMDICIARGIPNSSLIWLFWFLNNGDGTFGDPDMQPLNVAVAHEMQYLDIDQDGLKDLVVLSNFDGLVNWSKNNGAGDYDEFAPLISGYSLRNIIFGDDDADGDLDIIARYGVDFSAVSNLVRLEQTGDLNFAAPEILDFGDSVISATVFADIENDGDLDVFVAYTSSTFISVFLNDGIGNYNFNDIILNDSATNELFALDWNEDGYTDIISVHNLANEISVHTNNGSWLNEDIALISEAGPGLVVIQDIDQDDDLDLVFRSTGGQLVLFVAQNDGNNNFPSPTALTYRARSCAGLFCQDFDGDNINDLVYSDDERDHINMVKGNGYGSFGLPQILADYHDVNIRKLKKADFDQDGDDDLIIERHHNFAYHQISILKRDNDGLSFTDSTFLPDDDMRLLEIGDFNGDQLPDLLMTYAYEYFFWIENENNGEFDSEQQNVLTESGYETCILNTNNDIYSDYAYQNFWQDIVVCSFTDVGTTTSVTVVEDAMGIAVDLLGADMNMDGFEDLVVSTGNINAWYENDGAGSFVTAHSIPSGNWFLFSMVAADLNDDLYPELIVVRPGWPSSLIVFPNDGTGELGSPIFLYTAEDWIDKLAVGDVDHDGKPDLIATTDYGELFWMRNLGDVCDNWMAEVSDDQAVCPPGEMVSITASGGLYYYWDNGSLGPQIDVTIDSDSTFYVTVVNSEGCQQTLPVDIELLPEPNIVVSLQGTQLVATGGIAYQWNFNYEVIEGATGSTYTPLQNGLYSATGISDSGCEDNSAIIIFNGINVDENVQEAWLLFPNPGTDRFTLIGDAAIQSVRLTDMTGRLLHFQNVTNQSGEIALPFSLSSGQYIIQVVAQNGLVTSYCWMVD